LQEMLTIKSDDVYGRSKAYEAIIKKTEIVGPKVPESFNVLVKELQGLGLKVDLVTSDTVIDAEAVLATNVMQEAANPSSVDVPAPVIADLDLSEESTADYEEADLSELEEEIEDPALVAMVHDDSASDVDGDDDIADSGEGEEGKEV